ncbi:MAG: glycerophosphodiester phosphodiesterase family protein [Clostridia bacterium]|nr:glycerophosphodiester phosphodiesterase family protein [Clostridia bacterium]
MAHKLLKSASVMMLLVLIFNIFATSVAAINNDDFSTAEDVICISHRGDWHSFPENSLEAVKAAIRYGAVSVDVKVTKDGKAVLMADDTTDRMVVDADGKTVSRNVSDLTLEELTALYLRAENGGEDKAKTECKVASLEAAITAAGDTALILNLNCEAFDTVYQTVKELNATDKVIFRFNTDSNNDIIETTQNAKDITVFGNYQGNIIFLATSAVKNSFKNGMTTVELGSKNGNGVLYDELLMSYFENEGRAMVSMVGGRSGKRPDNERGWDDLITLGYSVIETDYPEQLSVYLDRIEDEKKQLAYFVDLYKSTDLQPYTTDTENAFADALTNAQVLCDSVSSLSELQNARFSLQSSYDNLTLGEKKAVTLKFDFTVGRLLAVVLVGAAFVVSQILLFKRRDKNKKAQ